jgi:hypothetical protein
VGVVMMVMVVVAVVGLTSQSFIPILVTLFISVLSSFYRLSLEPLHTELSTNSRCLHEAVPPKPFVPLALRPPTKAAMVAHRDIYADTPRIDELQIERIVCMLAST